MSKGIGVSEAALQSGVRLGWAQLSEKAGAGSEPEHGTPSPFCCLADLSENKLFSGWTEEGQLTGKGGRI